MISKRQGVSRRDLMKLAAAGAVAAGSTGMSVKAATVQTTSTAKLFHTVSGEGRNVMLLHGWTCDSNDWSWQMGALEARYRVVAVDLRGHGASEVMPSGSYTPDDYLADVEALIGSEFEGKPFIVIGHSMGGQIAARLAAKRPELVDAVVSVDGALGFSDALTGLFQDVTNNLASGDLGDVIPPLFDAFYDEATPEAFKIWHARRPLGMAEQAVRESFGPLFLGENQVGVGANSEAFCRSLTIPFYHMCRSPDQAEAMKTWFSHPKSKVELWTGAGHWISQDRPDDANKAIVDWLETLNA
ncbi:MAG: alpha/beta hydrolase [Rhizobiaceae bacterium]|nr:alpha/beta hydrolase [Rhizobiaceae bacterium]